MLKLSEKEESEVIFSRFCYKNLLEEYVPTLRELLAECNKREEHIEVEKFLIRLKSLESIVAKCTKKQLLLNTEKILQEVEDGAGIRIICSYIEDIYEVVDCFKDYFKTLSFEQKNFEQDYLDSYLHPLDFIVKLPISFLGTVTCVPLEIQLCSCEVSRNNLRFSKIS